MRLRFVQIMAAMAVLVLAVGAAPTAASAEAPWGEVQSWSTGSWCLSANNTPLPGFPANTSQAYTTACAAGNAYHLWDIAWMNQNDSAQFQNKKTADCLSTNL